MRETSLFLYHLFRCYFYSRELFIYPQRFSAITTTTTIINETRIMVKNFDKLVGVFQITPVFSTTLESYTVTSLLITLTPTLIARVSTPTQSTDQPTHHQRQKICISNNELLKILGLKIYLLLKHDLQTYFSPSYSIQFLHNKKQIPEISLYFMLQLLLHHAIKSHALVATFSTAFLIFHYFQAAL